MNYPGAVLIVSHDRYFLNRVVTKVIEIEHGEIMSFPGNYTEFAEKKKQVREAKLKEYFKQQQEKTSIRKLLSKSCAHLTEKNLSVAQKVVKKCFQKWYR